MRRESNMQCKTCNLQPVNERKRLWLFYSLTGCRLHVLHCMFAFTFLALPARADTIEPVPANVQESVDRAITWLAQNQTPEGTWPQGGSSKTAVPSLAAMALLARGHVPGQGPYGEILNNAIDFVLASQHDDGVLGGTAGNQIMYEHGISTVMLSEVFGMVDETRKEKISRALAKSVKLILDAQKPNGQPKPAPYTGGWRYSPISPDADLSVTGWQLMALRGAANCGAAVPKSALDAGLDYVKRSASPGGGFGYQPGQGPNQARTGTGILSMEMLGQHHSPEALKGGDFLLASPPDNPGQEFYFYSVYYCAQALNQLGGKYWAEAYPKLRDALLKQQDTKGHWPGGGGQEAEAGDAYRTSMAVLALCVPYRYLPLYQK